MQVLAFRAASTAALAVAMLLGACAQIPREPLIHAAPVVPRNETPMRLAPPVSGAIYRTGFGAQALFEDRRPRYVGDILTIVISENVNASKASTANASRNGSAGLELGLIPRIFGGLISSAQDASASGKNVLDAKGGAQAMNTFNGVITVTVMDVLPSGNLLVGGEKQMLINQGTEFIRFSGVVNPRTVSALNTVPSTQVADARIEYSAKGYIDEAQTMGWLQRIFLNVLPF
jgi:flagellar L-ring protein precursor FlgH